LQTLLQDLRYAMRQLIDAHAAAPELLDDATM